MKQGCDRKKNITISLKIKKNIKELNVMFFYQNT